MYQAVSNYVIVKREPQQEATSSGIIITKLEETYIKRLLIVATNSSVLENKRIIVEGRNFIDFGDGYGGVKEENIVAVITDTP